MIDGRNGCYTAELANVSVEEGLVVSVESNEDRGDELCTDCLMDVAYEARIAINAGVPNRIVIEHDGSKVTECDDRE